MDIVFQKNAIPIELKNAQAQLVIEMQNGVDIMPTINSYPVKAESVGPIKTEYEIMQGSIFTPSLMAVDSFLKPLLKNASSGFSLKTIRV